MSTIFSPSPQELAIVAQIFAFADPNKLGVITGDAAIKIFAGTKLSPIVLGEIWDLADQENKGWLAKKNVAIAVRLIAWAQKGEKVSTDLLAKRVFSNPARFPPDVDHHLSAGPLPTIEGLTTLAQQHTGMSLPRSPPPSQPALPPLTPQDKLKFQRMFASYNPVKGLLSGL
jgi:epidermal growth factor receptor substrate 15